MSDKNLKGGWFFNVASGERATSATIVFDGTIGGYNWEAETMEDFVQNRKNAFRNKIKDLANEGVNELHINIDSLGGLLNHGLVIHDLLKGFNGTVTTTTYGMTASAATLIAQAASKGKRRISANSFYLIHKAMVSPVNANSNSLEDALNESKKMDETIKNIYKRNTTKKNAKRIDSLMEANNGYGTWIDAYEAVNYGLADEVVVPDESNAVNWTNAINAAKDLKLPEFTQEFINKIDNISSIERKQVQELKPNRIFNMGFIKDTIEAFKTRGWKVTNEQGEEVTADVAEQGLTAEQMTTITNEVVNTAVEDIKKDIDNLKQVETPTALTKEDVENVVKNVVSELVSNLSRKEDVTNEVAAMNQKIENVTNKINTLSAHKAKEAANDLAPVQAVENGASLDLDKAVATAGFEIKVEENR